MVRGKKGNILCRPAIGEALDMYVTLKSPRI